MKGVILSRCPGACIVDISHESEAFSIYSGAYTISQSAPYFPRGTVHVVVIDPGVGTARRALLVQALGQSFVAPDNGVLTFILSDDSSATVREITNPGLWLESPSTTFHGRDLFAPVAATLAVGKLRPEDAGAQTRDYVLLPGWNPKQVAPDCCQGFVLSVDHFWNIITSFKTNQFKNALTKAFAFSIHEQVITDLQTTFAHAARGHCFAYFGSSGYLELGINQGHAARSLGVSIGDPIRLQIGV